VFTLFVWGLPAILFVLVQQILQYASIPQHCNFSCIVYCIVVIVGRDLVPPYNHGFAGILDLTIIPSKRNMYFNP